jgi:N-acetylmuramoyl-L-alanine amidase
MRTLVIDPGHGGKQTGAIGLKGTKESIIVLSVALKLKELAKNDFNVILTREIDKEVSPNGVPADLISRATLANNRKADLFVSIHCNGLMSVVKGIETWYHNIVTPKGKNLITQNKKYATLLYEELHNSFQGHNKRGVQPDTNRYKSGFGVLRPLEVPGALVELEFITNPEMETLLLDPKNQELFAKAILSASKRYMEG